MFGMCHGVTNSVTFMETGIPEAYLNFKICINTSYITLKTCYLPLLYFMSSLKFALYILHACLVELVYTQPQIC